MKKYTFWSFIFVLIVLTALAVIFTHKGVNALIEPEISNFEVSSDSSFDDFYTDVNGFLLNRKIKGTFEIDSQTEFFICYYSTSSNYLVLITSYIFTDTNVVDFEDDFLPIYDDNMLVLIQLINNWLLNNTNYNILLNNAIYYIINDYFNSVGFYYSGERLALITTQYNGDYYNIFKNNFGELNSTYCYRDLINYIYSYYSDILQDIDSYFQDEIEYEKSVSYDEGYADGLISDSNQAYLQGKSAGYTDAIEEGKQVSSYIFGMWDTMMNGIRDMFDVDIFGINLSSVIFFVLSIGVIGFVLRRIF